MWGSGGGVPSRRRPTGFRGEAPGRCGDFTAFFLKKYAFLGIFWPKFLLKHLFFKCLKNVCLCASKACTPGRMAPPAPFAATLSVITLKF